jgi:hypothetical protein
MIILPLALILGAGLGLVMRNRRRLILVVAIATPLLSVLALVAQFVPGGVESCQSTTFGTSTCEALPAVEAWDGPVPFAIAVALIVLSLAPLVSARTGAWWPAAASAALQAIPQVISFGGFIDWAPALLATVAVACGVGWSSQPASSRASSYRSPG